MSQHKSGILYSAFVLGIFICLFYAAGYFLISSYYENHPGHYDTVGTYYSGFQILDAVRAYGIANALNAIPDANYYLSPLQAYFSLAFGFILSKSEASYHLYNTLGLAWAFGAT